MTESTVLQAAREQVPGRRGYLDSATYGLPSTATLHAVEEHLGQWRDGTGTLPSWDVAVQESRRLFAQLLEVPAEWVAVGSQVSVATGAVAASLPAGSRVVLAADDFTSLTWPFLARRDLRCRIVRLRDVPDAAASADWVAVSAVQSCDGEVLDLAALAATAAASSTRVLLDATQAAGWLPVDAASFDVVTVGAYKWLSCPRGAAFTTFRPDVLTELTPCAPGWYAGDQPLERLYSDDVHLARDARRFDVSPAWVCWAGTVPALRAVAELGVAAIHTHNVGLANRLRRGLGLADSNSAIVAVDLTPERVTLALASGVRASARAGRLRLALHFYNDDEDVDRLLEVLTGCAART